MIQKKTNQQCARESNENNHGIDNPMFQKRLQKVSRIHLTVPFLNGQTTNGQSELNLIDYNINTDQKQFGPYFYSLIILSKIISFPIICHVRTIFFLRRGGDLNSRNPFELTAFRMRRLQPLSHLSKYNSLNVRICRPSERWLPGYRPHFVRGKKKSSFPFSHSATSTTKMIITFFAFFSKNVILP